MVAGRKTAIALLGALTLACCGVPAFARQASDVQRAGQLPVNEPGGVLARDPSRSERWTLRFETTLQNPEVFNGSRIVPAQYIEGEGFRAVFPLIDETASSVGYMREARMRIAQATRVPWSGRAIIPDRRLTLPDNTITNVFEAVEVGPFLDRFGVLSVPSVRSERLTLTVELDVRSWATVVHEQRADAVEWPVEAYPENVVRYLGAPTAATSDDNVFAQLLRQWTNGHDPKSVRPYALAKHLAREMMLAERAFIRNDPGLFPSRGDRPRGLFSGLGGPTDATAGRQSGSDLYDRLTRSMGMDQMLVSLYRAAGLPARIVRTYATQPEPVFVPSANQIVEEIRRERLRDGRPIFERPTATPRWRNPVPPVGTAASLRAWVEFALYDEQRGVTEWIPVDIEAQFEWSNQPPALTLPWRYFGNHADAHRFVPFAIGGTPPAGLNVPPTWGSLVSFNADFATPPSSVSSSVTGWPTRHLAGEPFDPLAR